MGWYKTGTVSVNAGETSLTGVGVKFASNARVGDGLRGPDGRWYEVVNIASETVLGIYPPYRGDTVSGSADYMIAPLQGYNKDSADRLRWVTDNIRNFDAEVAAVQDAAARAKVSEDAAKLSETNAKTSETNAKTSETNAKTSETNSSTSELSASNSASLANNSQLAAKISEDNAKASELAAKISETNAKTSETNAKASQDDALVSKNAAKDSELAAKLSENNALASELSAQTDAATATTGASTATIAKDAAVAAKTAAEQARDDAIAAAGSVTGQVQDLGTIDLSGGVYPAKPVVSSFWNVVVGGTATDNGITIEYGVGDTLWFSKPVDQFYKIDNTDSVTSVAGKTGVVTLNKNDVGLDQVDNTSDLSKPISTAVQTQLDNRTPTVGNVDTTTGRLVKVGDYGMNGGPTLAKASNVDANTLTTPGRYNFTSGGINLPSGVTSCYIDVYGYGSLDSFTKQVLFGFQTNIGCFERYQASGSWSAWKAVGTNVTVIDDLTSTSTTAALSANQGKVLKDMIDEGGGGGVNISRFTYNLSAGQTVVGGVDLSGATLSYTPGVPFFVDLNGFPIWIGNDYTATNGTSIVLTTGVEAASEISITVFKAKAVNDTYTKAEIDGKIGASALPVGLTVPWSLSEATIPGGMLPYNGQLVSRAVWPTLWALYSSQAISDATWLADPLQRGKPSTGDGSTTFRLPDFNGKHSDGLTPAAAVLRGYGKNSAGTPGLFQLDQLQNITGSFLQASSNASGTDDTPLGAFSSVYLSGDGTGRSGGSAVNRFKYEFDASRVARTGTETRGTNVTVIWCVVAATALQNIGSVDVLALANKVTALESRVSDLEYTFTPADQAWTNGGLVSVAHGFPSAPTRISIELVCVVAEANYAVGTILPMGPTQFAVSGTTGYGYQTYITNSTINIKVISNGIQVWNATANSGALATAANWRFRIKASK